MDAAMDRGLYEWMDGWRNELMDRWMVGWLNAWRNE